MTDVPVTQELLPHEYSATRVGHGEAQCIHCHGTNRENAIISPNGCTSRPRQSSSEGAIPATREPYSPADDELHRAFIDGWNARIDNTDFDMAMHHWMLSQVTWPATPTPPAGSQRGDDALREALARAMYDSSPHTVISPALSDLTGLPVGSVLTWDAAVAAGADMSALYRYADAVLTLATPVLHKADEGVDHGDGSVEVHRWINSAYGCDPRDMSARFTRFNMVVAYRAGEQAVRATLSPAPCLSDERDKLEAAQEAAFQMIYGPGADAFHIPDAFDFAGQVAEAVIAALDTPSTGEEGK